MLILLPTDHNKLLMQWKGPFEVSSVVGLNDYKVKVKGKEKVYHANLLKKYFEREETTAEGAVAGGVGTLCEDDAVDCAAKADKPERDNVGLCFFKVIHSQLKPLRAQRTLEQIT